MSASNLIEPSHNIEVEDSDSKTELSSTDKYFLEQRNVILQDINNTMDSILNGLNELNISLENSIAVGKEFESISLLWKNFYNELEENVEGEDDGIDNNM
ncbi:hypothetical protein KAFR_0E01120 [Kazachstania africana CBS 2517]|uniref:DASH complex subunit DAD1 n=1 Tax=Kazachstania africana (strain ATCC 22294 / BCRC 22015 / CBS 2517 / CECT 1963 / NBRC 1671 / NRRL Y-8276) TaxID=1071382 RepID=H2AV66_KAZAF|nr:hypothetical protein KAFR_0E01120 [Kazachstania africana CBS 2517]CCF58266.1 hypothetical protein KAFR_0E01120 [Kazachstania africana CBS 2517]